MSTPIPPTMKTWLVTANGPPSSKTLSLSTTHPTPPSPPRGANLLIRVSHAALNPVDLHLINVLPTWLPFRRTATPGMDFAGTVVAAGPGVKGLSVGDRVCGALGVRQIAFGTGTLAEYISVPQGQVVTVPEGMEMRQAAGMMGIAGQTATLVVNAAGGLKEGERVLINGASGGVGSILVQAAKGKGAYVVAVCGAGNRGFVVERLGADEHVDYARAEPDLEGELERRFGVGEGKGLDWIFDCAGGQALYDRCPGYLKEGGRFVSIVGGRTQGIVPFVRNKLRPVMLGGTPRGFDLLGLSPSGRIAEEVKGWVEKGVVRETPMDSEYKMEDALEAFEKLASKHAKGKIIINIAE
ncbi:putative alcohol dehydrogenase [Podospora aff. communis PSN243]|uniref:Alcohol dehydrogenase n=1 Tax=Podospora aff. communis PSN243 TaxID=3040156 RepID=A0AAV9GIH4_9PEZI|nr:putative alcohol dehydrogenase [Podospora aff. communis PSN243]